MGKTCPLFHLFSPFSFSNNKYCFNFNIINWLKCRWCVWDSNPGPQDGSADKTTCYGGHPSLSTYSRSIGLFSSFCWSLFDEEKWMLLSRLGLVRRYVGRIIHINCIWFCQKYDPRLFIVKCVLSNRTRSFYIISRICFKIFLGKYSRWRLVFLMVAI